MVEKMTDFSENKNYNVGEILVPYEIPDMENFNGIMFVAEAPGANEEENQKPLVGISGKNFDEWLREAKIKRKDSIIANVFRFRPLKT
jgi:uracil-DNA glycosylase family 4